MSAILPPGGAAAAAIAQNAYVAGNWYWCCPGITPASGAIGGLNTIHWTPFFVSAAITIEALGIRIDTLSVGGNIQLALYASSAATGLPTGAALGTTANMSTTTTGLVSGAIGPVSIQPGIYWVGVNADNATAIVQVTGNGPSNNGALVGATSQAFLSPGAAFAGTQYTTTQTYGTWPAGPAIVEATDTQKSPMVNFQILSVP